MRELNLHLCTGQPTNSHLILRGWERGSSGSWLTIQEVWRVMYPEEATGWGEGDGCFNAVCIYLNFGWTFVWALPHTYKDRAHFYCISPRMHIFLALQWVIEPTGSIWAPFCPWKTPYQVPQGSSTPGKTVRSWAPVHILAVCTFFMIKPWIETFSAQYSNT